MAKSNSDKQRFVRLERKFVDEASSFLYALGNQFVKVGNADGAFDCFKYSVDLNPHNQAAVYNLGALYNAMGNLEGAYRMFKESSRMLDSDLKSRTALGEVSRKLGKIDEAREVLLKVAKDDPEDFDTMTAMAVLDYDCGDLKGALEWNAKALEKRPADSYTILNRTLVNMIFGRWREYWSDYEFCLSYQKNQKMSGLRMTDAWSGQEMPGKSIMVISDQGHGDAIQFSRYLAEAKTKGKFAHLTYLVQPDLKDLLSRVDGVDEVIGFGERERHNYDAFSSLLGIMRVLRVSPDDCYRAPHIVTDDALDYLWSARIADLWDGKSKKVGIVWAGDPRHGNDHARSIPLSLFLKIFDDVEGAQVFSFQVGDGPKQRPALKALVDHDIVDLGIDFRNFDDTASALKSMDLLISCDTAVPHLAGCLGVPAYVMVTAPPEWRWLLDRHNSVWYNHVSVFRQRTYKDWLPAIEEINQCLESWMTVQD